MRNIIPIPKEDRLTIYNVDLDSAKRYYVYAHIDNNGHIFYIGKGTGKRAFDGKNRNFIWQRIAKEGFSVNIIADFMNEEDAYLTEMHYIDKIVPKANLAKYGFCGAIDQTNRNPRKQSIESNLKRKKACTDFWIDNPERSIRSKKFTKEGNPFFGAKHSKESVIKMKKSHFSPIVCINLLNDEEFTVSGTRNAAELTGIPRQTIMRLLSNPNTKQKVKWKFKRI
jgi:hypothetical protein